MDHRAYWQKVRLQREALADEYPVVISVESTDSLQCTEVTQAIAAKNLVDGTHRLATPDEIAAWRADQKARAEAIRKAELDKRQPIVVYAGQPPAETPAAADATKPKK
jgi:hypothetical protein